MAKKIIHFPNKCAGCLACVGLAPQIFEYDDANGKARLISGTPSEIDGEEIAFRVVEDEMLGEDLANLVVGSCCTQAIKVEQVNGDDVYEGEEEEGATSENDEEDGGEA